MFWKLNSPSKSTSLNSKYLIDSIYKELWSYYNFDFQKFKVYV